MAVMCLMDLLAEIDCLARQDSQRSISTYSLILELGDISM